MGKLLKLIKENWLLGAIAFLLFFIPVYPKLPLVAVPKTAVAIRLEDILVACVVGLFVVERVIKRDFSLLKDPLVSLLALYFGIGFVSVLNAIFITKNIIPHLAFLHLLRRIEYVSLLFVTYYSFKNLKQLKIYGWVVWLTSFLVIIYGLGQKFMGWPVVSTMNEEFARGMILTLDWWARINSTFAGHYDLAAFMALTLPLIVVALILAKKWAIKTPIFLLGLFSYYILLLTASRISFISYLAGVSLVLILTQKKWWIIPFLTVSILGMVFAGDLGQRYAATFKINLNFLSGKVRMKETPQLAQVPTPTPTPTLIPTPSIFLPPARVANKATPTPTPTPTSTLTPESKPSGSPLIESTELAVGRSTDIRLKVEWPRAVRAFLKNPLLGTGYSSITLATDNDYLRMLGEVGLLGTVAFLGVMLEIGRRFFLFLQNKKVGREERLIILGIVGATVGYFINAAFIDVFEASKLAFFFWILIGVALRVIDLSKTED